MLTTNNGLIYHILKEDLIFRNDIYNVRCWLIEDEDAKLVLKAKQECTSCRAKKQTYYLPELDEHLCEDCALDYINNNYITPNDLYSVNEAVINYIRNTIYNDIINENEADRLLSSLENSETEL